MLIEVAREVEILGIDGRYMSRAIPRVRANGMSMYISFLLLELEYI
jgi:hypothetical protein